MYLFLDGWLTDKKYKDVGGGIKKTGRHGEWEGVVTAGLSLFK